jgi:nucleotide-binding universal stress UspA family protein
LEVSTFQSEPAFDIVQQADEEEVTRLYDVCAHSADTLRRAGLVPAFSVLEGIPGQILVEEAERLRADAIFVGACRHGRLDHVLLGSVSTHVATHAHCAVEVVRRQEVVGERPE